MTLDKPLNLDFSIFNSENMEQTRLVEKGKKLEFPSSERTDETHSESRNELGRIPQAWSQKILHERNLTSLADHFGSDKGFRKHLYTTVYQEFIVPDKVQSLLELGLLCHDDQRKLGNGDSFSKAPSLDMWCAFLPNAEVYGFDIKDFSSAEGDWKGIVQGDQSNRDDLAKIIGKNQFYDVIIDDALHASKHQQVSFSYLFPYVRRGGLFIIEDLHYQPFPEDNEVKTLVLLERLKMTGCWDSKHATREEAIFIEENVDCIQFYDSMKLPRETSRNALCVIRKK